jgi:hypothetical protein
MRKGRSHRRTNRVSRPSLLGSNVHPSAPNALESGVPSSPQVVIGVSNTPPPVVEDERDEVANTRSSSGASSAAPSSVLPANEISNETSEPPPASEKRIATMRPARQDRIHDTLIDARPPCEASEPSEPSEPCEPCEPSDAALEVAAKVEDKVDEEPAEPKPNFASTAIMGGMGSFDPNAPVTKSTLILGSSAPEPKDDDDDAKIDRMATSADEPVPTDTIPGLGDKKDLHEDKVIVAKTANVAIMKEEMLGVEPTPTPSGVVLPIEDEISVPPIVNEPTLERFFSEGDIARLSADEEPELLPEKLTRKAAPHVVQRRQRFARYVTWAVGISAVLCLAAVARTALSPKAQVAPPRAAAGAIVAPIVKEEPKPVAVAVADPPKVEAKESPPAAPNAEAQPAAEPPKAEPTPSPSAEAPAAPPEGDAKEEKAACKKALNLGKVKDAIAAGERSVAIDPTDGEAWLLLGASYQEAGKLAEARRCYTACVKEGKTGPRNECAKMLR